MPCPMSNQILLIFLFSEHLVKQDLHDSEKKVNTAELHYIMSTNNHEVFLNKIIQNKSQNINYIASTKCDYCDFVHISLA